MKRRIKTVVFLLTVIITVTELATIASVSAGSASLSSKNVIIVDQGGNGDYTTISEALANAPEGATIFIKAGEYSEIINIRKKVSLIGEDVELVTINPISQENKYAVRLGAPGIVVQKLSITNGAPGLYSCGIRVSASNTEIRECRFFDNPVGMAVLTSDNIIADCTFYRCTDEGIVLVGSGNLECDNNRIENCVFYDNCDGIELQYSSNNVITNCEFYDNTHTGIDAIASSNDNNIISNCNIHDNQVHGIYLSSSSDNQIIDCSFSENKDGDVIMNKNSKNNDIITSDDNNENVKENIFTRILNRILSLNRNRVIPLFTLNKF